MPKDLRTERMVINMGPHHPSTHGVCRLILIIDGEEIIDCEPVIGYLHRSIEKMCENRTYFQCLPLMDRFEYVTSMSCSWAFALAAEKLTDLEVPERAEYLRVIMGELNRIASHLLCIGVTGLDLGALTPFLYTFRERELILDLFEMTCGQRLTYNYIRMGGVSKDIPTEFIPKCREFLDIIDIKCDDYEKVLTENPIWIARNKGIGIITEKMVYDYAVSGPSARASGVSFDIRKDDTYSIYDRFNFDAVVYHGCDSYDRYRVRMGEIRQSARIIRQALDQLPEGPITAKAAIMTFKTKKGEVYSRIENSRGEMGIHLISDGTKKPFRVRARGGSYNHLLATPEIVKGLKIADLVAIFASLDIIMPEIDR
ncbi:MAG: NADH-quinone oxidoreductase subunit D [candidate division Zixibacteria bacterium]